MQEEIFRRATLHNNFQYKTYHSVPVVRGHVSSLRIVPCSFTVRYSVEVGMSTLEIKQCLLANTIIIILLYIAIKIVQ